MAAGHHQDLSVLVCYLYEPCHTSCQVNDCLISSTSSKKETFHVDPPPLQKGTKSYRLQRNIDNRCSTSPLITRNLIFGAALPLQYLIYIRVPPNWKIIISSVLHGFYNPS